MRQGSKAETWPQEGLVGESICPPTCWSAGVPSDVGEKACATPAARSSLGEPPIFEARGEAA